MDEARNNFSFRGTGGELFGIYIVNVLLTIITLGIYYFWAQVRITKFFHNHTYVNEDNFDYHATGKEKFIGFLKAIGIFIVYFLILFGLEWLLKQFLPQNVAGIISVIIIIATYLLAIPFIIIGMRRYLLSRTSFRNIRFRFTGQYQELVKEFIIGSILSMITLGIYVPWFICKMNKYFTDNSYYGSEAFSFDGDGKDLFLIYLKGILLTIITLGIYGFWFQANLIKFFMNRTKFQGKSLESTITGGKIFKTSILGILLAIFTLGLGIPWVMVMFYKMYVDTTLISGAIDYSSIESNIDQGANATADGIADAADVVGDIFS